MRVPLVYLPCCPVPNCLGKQGELSENSLPKLKNSSFCLPVHACLTLKFVGQVSKQVLVSVHHCFCLEDGNKTWLNEVSPDSNFFLVWHGPGASGTNSDLKSGMYWGSRIGSHVGGIFHFLAKLGLVLFAVSLWRLAEECHAIKDNIWSSFFTFLTLPHVFIWESIFCKISPSSLHLSLAHHKVHVPLLTALRCARTLARIHEMVRKKEEAILCF